jgi:hypothetical protein
MNRYFFFALLFTITFSSCKYVGGKRIRGNGTVLTENREAGTFNGVHVSGNADLYVKQDSVYSVRVEADENLMEHIITEVNDGTLKIRPRDGANLKPSRSIKVYVSGPSFSNFRASGACDILSENKITSSDAISIHLSGASDVKMELMSPKVEAGLSGAGSITLWGQTKNFTVEGSGSTDIKCFDLQSENTNVEISGAGDAEVFASVQLDVRVSGAGDVKYKGNATVSKQISGAGSVKKVE